MQNIQNLLQASAFSCIVQKGLYINQLNKAFNKIPCDINQHCQVVNIQSTCLILEANNSAQATKLRYQTPELLAILKTHKDFSDIKSLHWQVKKTDHQDTRHPKKYLLKPAQLAKTAKVLLASSEYIKNKKLKISMEKLASNMDKSGNLREKEN